jgi:hypothetical protein
MLVLDDLRSGKVVAPFGFAPGPHKLVLWLAPHASSRPGTRALIQWLSEELKETGRDDAKPLAASVQNVPDSLAAKPSRRKPAPPSTSRARNDVGA